MIKIDEKVPEKNNESKVGVFICTCGGKISSKVDIKALETKLGENRMIEYVEEGRSDRRREYERRSEEMRECM